MAKWTLLTSRARALLRIAHDPEVRLRDIAASRGITERSAYGTVTDLTEDGYVVKQKNEHRNRYQTRAHLPLPEPSRRHPAGRFQTGCVHRPDAAQIRMIRARSVDCLVHRCRK